MGKNRVTTQDIAAKAGVSKATVSYVLNDTGSVSAEVTKRVLAYAKELGYQENRLAKATRTGKTNIVGLVLPDLCNPFFPKMAQAVVNAASQKDYSVFLVDARNSLEEEATGISRLTQYAIEGLIWCPLHDAHSIERNKFSCPVVMTDRSIPGFGCVCANSQKGGQLQAELVKKYGHKRIGVLTGPERSLSAQIRRKGLYESLTADIEVVWDYSLEYELSIPKDIADKILNSDISCIVAANDTLAIGVLRLLHGAGIKVPEQISIIGFDAIEWSDLVSPPLSTIELPIQEIGTAAFDILLKRLANPDAAIREVMLDVNVIERGSIARLPEGVN